VSRSIFKQRLRGMLKSGCRWLEQEEEWEGEMLHFAFNGSK